MNTNLRRIGVAVTAGGTVLFPLGFTLVQSPAYAALLEFNFTTEQGGLGSFTLDTSVANTRPDISIFGIYPDAISNFTFSGTRPAAAQGELVVQSSQLRINSAAYGGPFRGSEGDGPVSQLNLNFSRFSPIGPNFLPSDPSQYVPVFPPVGSILFSTGGNPSETINSLTVRSRAIPDSTNTFGLLALSALGAGSAFHQKLKQKLKNKKLKSRINKWLSTLRLKHTNKCVLFYYIN